MGWELFEHTEETRYGMFEPKVRVAQSVKSVI